MAAPRRKTEPPLLQCFGTETELEVQYRDLAVRIARTLSGAEATVALRKLLESSDAAKRAVTFGRI